MDTMNPTTALHVSDDSVPDLMNDPEYATNFSGEGDDNGDTDTCRICRGEATEQEPLFYPCKCSGSIKFVHQNCLMEWLSHSQKKHCELCKTPFRFTKLYSPNMPPTLPFHVFLRHLIVHTFKNFATWLRLCFVLFIWLGCLPFLMRFVWGFLFWLGDGGWTSPGSERQHSAARQALAIAREQMEILAAHGTSPSSPLHARPTSASMRLPVDKLPIIMTAFSQTLVANASDPLLYTFFRSIFYGLGFQSATESSSSNLTAATNHIERVARRVRPSLLGDVQFLKNLTRHPKINNALISVMEGQIITIIVVVCFILVFLIREWVVQQQPGINMGAGFNAEFVGGGERGDGGRENPREIRPQLRALEAPNPAPGADGALADAVAVNAAARPVARPRHRMVPAQFDEHGYPVEAHTPGVQDIHRSDSSNDNNANLGGRVAGEGSQRESQAARPAMPGRDATSSVVEIQRRLTEVIPRIDPLFDVGEFVSVWRRAEGSPEEVLRIIEAEGLGDKLRYWKNAMKALQVSPPQATAPTGGQISTDSLLSTKHNESSSQSDLSNQSGSPETDRTERFESWTKVSVPSEKGKGKASENSLEPLFDPAGTLPGIDSADVPSGAHGSNPMLSHGVSVAHGVSGRARASSDGPALRDIHSPLGSNSWSFNDLSQEILRTARSEAPSPENEDISQTGQNRRVRNAVENGGESGILRQRAALNAQATTSDYHSQVEVRSGDKAMLGHTWDDIFAQNPIPESDDELLITVATNSDHGGPEGNPFHPDGLLPPDQLNTAPPIVPPRRAPEGVVERIVDWLWGDMEPRERVPFGDDEHIVHDLAAEAPFVPVAVRDQGEIVMEAQVVQADVPNGRDPDAHAAALAAGIDPNDPDGIDDVEDFEGIMELVGMRGPLLGLLQNGIFMVLLISLTVACGVWIPYNVGRLSLLLVANPVPTFKLPLKFIFGAAAIMQDLSLIALGTLSYLVLKALTIPLYLWSFSASGPESTSGVYEMLRKPGFALDCIGVAVTAAERIGGVLIGTISEMPDSEVPAFSAVSHESLIYIKSTVINSLELVGSFVASAIIRRDSTVPSQVSLIGLSDLRTYAVQSTSFLVEWLLAVPAFLMKSDSWVVSIDIAPRATPVDPSLSYWGGMDRFWAVVAGYLTFCLVGAAYLRKGSPFSTGQAGRDLEATLIDVLNQAGGVMKVILIISIEMLVFPLYCGLLLDLALLPLFENATVLSRLLFTIDNPLTSIFVHWFVGTCYMFHFALFVSMCRKIMRTGVLYFIRDPDDPTFHPVRDVLERNVATQLRKITFSAMVYGALVVVCLGGVVWGLSFTFDGVLPIHWNSNEPVLEFPIDLLFYNFFMPLAVKFFKPSDGLHAMYAWWFRTCARTLRLTHFLFDERMKDEEGHHVRRSWSAVLRGIQGDHDEPVKMTDTRNPLEEQPDLEAYFKQDGRFVRTPASDQVRIPKGERVFLEVNEENERIDGKEDLEEDFQSRTSSHFKMVYAPPYFRTRIFLFIVFIWLFAAVTGTCITLVPLVFGRQMFARLIPDHVRKNDVYAFSIGVYILGSLLYGILHIKQGIRCLISHLSVDATTPINIFRKVASIGSWVLRLIYAYTAFAILLPILFSLVVEFYFIIPLHTYLAPVEPHTIHVVQSWTLGLLYVKLTTRLILWYEDSRPAEALRSVTRNGYWNPDIRIATRCFVLPATVVLLTLLAVPLGVGRLINSYNMLGSSDTQKALVYRYAYPLCLSAVFNLMGLWGLLGVMRGWRMKIRDEVYLIGERLHNFGERNRSGVSTLVPNSSRIET